MLQSPPELHSKLDSFSTAFRLLSCYTFLFLAQVLYRACSVGIHCNAYALFTFKAAFSDCHVEHNISHNAPQQSMLQTDPELKERSVTGDDLQGNAEQENSNIVNADLDVTRVEDTI